MIMSGSYIFFFFFFAFLLFFFKWLMLRICNKKTKCLQKIEKDKKKSELKKNLHGFGPDGFGSFDKLFFSEIDAWCWIVVFILISLLSYMLWFLCKLDFLEGLVLTSERELFISCLWIVESYEAFNLVKVTGSICTLAIVAEADALLLNCGIREDSFPAFILCDKPLFPTKVKNKHFTVIWWFIALEF